jgi:thiol-disulfide isomerase/thioredoxin
MHSFSAEPRRRFLLAAALFPLATGAAEDPQAQWKAWPRSRAVPPFELAGPDGTKWSLSAARGRPVLLNFWATWCEPCRAEMPSLQELARRHEAQGLRVLAANFKEGDAAVRRYLDASSLQLPVLFDRDGAAAKAFGVRIFPSTVGIDRKGDVKFVVTGEVDWAGAAAQRWVAALL